MLKTKDILDEKDKRLRMISKEVSFPLTKKDKDLIKLLRYAKQLGVEKKIKDKLEILLWIHLHN